MERRQSQGRQGAGPSLLIRSDDSRLHRFNSPLGFTFAVVSLQHVEALLS